VDLINTAKNKIIIANTSNGVTFLSNKSSKEIILLFQKGLTKTEITKKIQESFSEKFDFDLEDSVNQIINILKQNHFNPKNIRILEEKNGIPPLMHLQLDLTWACNLRCIHCYLSDNDKNRYRNITNLDILSLEDWKKIIDQAKSMNVPKLSILGGEPMLSKFFFDISKYAHEKGFRIYTTTNATLIDKSIAKKFKQSGYNDVDVSLDGAEQNEHEILRGEKTFAKTIEGIKNLIDADINVKIACIIHKKNYNNILKLFNLCKKLNVKHIYLNSLLPGGEGIKIFEDLSINNKEWQYILDVSGKWNEEKKLPLVFAEPRFLFDRYKKNKFLNDDNCVFAGCKAGKREMAISPEGFSIACTLLSSDNRFKSSNIKNMSLQKIWETDKYINIFRNINENVLNADCKICKHLKKCIGGCHAAAFLKTGDFCAKDPKCTI
jgi:radical SAM protein with 4Fe4S-binding SPASM domain